ncbi:hypothetical protein D3C86_1176970 [compost metagenome]
MLSRSQCFKLIEFAQVELFVFLELRRVGFTEKALPKIQFKHFVNESVTIFEG